VIAFVDETRLEESLGGQVAREKVSAGVPANDVIDACAPEEELFSYLDLPFVLT
jgi:hypothetical protein